MSDLVKKYAHRLGIQDTETIKKSLELLRLLDLKASKAITNQTAKLVLCIEWASIDCGTDLDHRQAVSLSGLSENDYNRQKGLIDKLLNLSKQLTIDEICAQLEINDRLKSDARQLYNAYQAKQTYYEGDTNSAPILTMAIYQSLKLRKTKNLAATKAKLVQLSKNRKLWKQLEDEWDKWIEKCAPLKSSAATATDNQKMQTNDKRNRNPSKCTDDEPMDTSPDDANGNRQTHTELSYEEWRNQMIAKAKQIIATAKTQQQNQMD